MSNFTEVVRLFPVLFKSASHFPVDEAHGVYGDVNIWLSGTDALECGMNWGSLYLCETHAALIDPGTFLQFLAKGEEGRLGALNGIFVGGERLKNSGFFRGVFSFSFSR